MRLPLSHGGSWAFSATSSRRLWGHGRAGTEAWDRARASRQGPPGEGLARMSTQASGQLSGAPGLRGAWRVEGVTRAMEGPRRSAAERGDGLGHVEAW